MEQFLYTDRRTDGHTDTRTDGQTDTTKHYSPQTIRNGWGLKMNETRYRKSKRIAMLIDTAVVVQMSAHTVQSCSCIAILSKRITCTCSISDQNIKHGLTSAATRSLTTALSSMVTSGVSSPTAQSRCSAYFVRIIL